MKKKLLTSTLLGVGTLILFSGGITPPVVNAATAPTNETNQATTNKAAQKITVTNVGNQIRLLVNTGTSNASLPNFFTIDYNQQQIKFNLSSIKDGAVTITENNQVVGNGEISARGTNLKASIDVNKTTMKAEGAKSAIVKIGNQQATTNIVNKTTSTATSKAIADKTGSSTKAKDESNTKQAKSTKVINKDDQNTTDPVHQVFHENSSKRKESIKRTPNSYVNGALNIKIDGNFSDWDNVEKSPMVINGDNDNIKYAALVADDQNIYFYVMMHPVLSGGYTSFQPSGYDLTIGGKEFWISFNNNQTVNLDVGQKQAVSMNIYSSDGSVDLSNQAVVAKQNIDQKMGDGSTVKGTGYVFECAVPFSKLKGISNTSGQTITLKNSNLWNGELTTTGGSTGPILLASTGVAIAGWSVYQFTRRKRKLGLK